MKPSELLDKALEVLADESDWCTGRLYKLTMYKLQHCLIGALRVAEDGCHHNVNWHTTIWASGPVVFEVKNALQHTIREQYHSEIGSLGGFNDNHTFGEVRSVMEKAKADLEEQGK